MSSEHFFFVSSLVQGNRLWSFWRRKYSGWIFSAAAYIESKFRHRIRHDRKASSGHCDVCQRQSPYASYIVLEFGFSQKNFIYWSESQSAIRHVEMPAAASNRDSQHQRHEQITWWCCAWRSHSSIPLLPFTMSCCPPHFFATKCRTEKNDSLSQSLSPSLCVPAFRRSTIHYRYVVHCVHNIFSLLLARCEYLYVTGWRRQCSPHHFLPTIQLVKNACP